MLTYYPAKPLASEIIMTLASPLLRGLPEVWPGFIENEPLTGK